MSGVEGGKAMTTARTRDLMAPTASERAAFASMAMEGRAVPESYEPSEVELQLLQRLFEDRGWV